jgi:hypothetical protein
MHIDTNDNTHQYYDTPTRQIRHTPHETLTHRAKKTSTHTHNPNPTPTLHPNPKLVEIEKGTVTIPLGTVTVTHTSGGATITHTKSELPPSYSSTTGWDGDYDRESIAVDIVSTVKRDHATAATDKANITIKVAKPKSIWLYNDVTQDPDILTKVPTDGDADDETVDKAFEIEPLSLLPAFETNVSDDVRELSDVLYTYRDTCS